MTNKRSYNKLKSLPETALDLGYAEFSGDPEGNKEALENSRILKMIMSSL